MEYRQTEHGKIREIYNRQKRNSIERGHKCPTYSIDEFMKWVLEQDIWQVLYIDWVNSGFNKNLAPSVDRIKNEEGYKIINIRLMTWEENNSRGNKDRLEGRHKTQHKAVAQFDKNGNFIADFVSINSATRATGINDYTISLVCRGKRKSAGGFIWKYKINKE